MFNAIVRYLPFDRFNPGDGKGGSIECKTPEAREINSSNMTHTQYVSNKYLLAIGTDLNKSNSINARVIYYI